MNNIMNISKINGEMWWCCPHCKEKIIIDSINEHKFMSEKPIFFDGDTIFFDLEQRTKKTNTNSLLLGKCFACFKNFFAINMTFINSNVSEAIDYVRFNVPLGKQINFVVHCKDGTTNSGEYQSFEHFSLNSYATPIGTLCNTILCILPLAPDEENQLIGINGVSSCSDSGIWQQATKMVNISFDRLQYVCININHYVEQDVLAH